MALRCSWAVSQLHFQCATNLHTKILCWVLTFLNQQLSANLLVAFNFPMLNSVYQLPPSICLWDACLSLDIRTVAYYHVCCIILEIRTTVSPLRTENLKFSGLIVVPWNFFVYFTLVKRLPKGLRKYKNWKRKSNNGADCVRKSYFLSLGHIVNIGISIPCLELHRNLFNKITIRWDLSFIFNFVDFKYSLV